MFYILTVLKMCLKRNKNAHNDANKQLLYITIKKEEEPTIRLFLLILHTQENELFMVYCEWVCVCICFVPFHFELLQFQSLLCSFISFPFSLVLLCASANTSASLCVWKQLWCYWNMYSVHFQPVLLSIFFLFLLFPFQWLFPLWVCDNVHSLVHSRKNTHYYSWMRCSS